MFAVQYSVATGSPNSINISVLNDTLSHGEPEGPHWSRAVHLGGGQGFSPGSVARCTAHQAVRHYEIKLSKQSLGASAIL